MTSLIPLQTEAAGTEFKVEKQGLLFNLLFCSYQENTSCLMRFQNIDSLSNFIRKFKNFCNYLRLKLPPVSLKLEVDLRVIVRESLQNQGDNTRKKFIL